jgi:phage pi2 protein 07
MAHDVLFNIPDRELGKSDIKFKVKKDGELFGTLEVSKGGIVWYPKGNSYGHKTGWSAFDNFMKEKPRAEKR